MKSSSSLLFRGYGLTKLMPAPVAKAIRWAYPILMRGRPFDLASVRPRREFDGTKVVVAGLFSTMTGLSRAAELVALQLEARGSEVIRVDISQEFNQSIGQELDEQMIASAGEKFTNATDLIVVLHPDFDIRAAFDLDFLKRVSVSAHWIWEIEKLPRYWKGRTASYDQIFAPTEWVLDSFRSHFPRKNVSLLPYAVDVDPWPPVRDDQRASAREKLGIEASDFVVGYAFAAHSNYYRKNPEALIAAFKKAYCDNPSVKLLLRSNDIHEKPVEEALFQAAIKGNGNIIFCGRSNRISLDDFYATLDVYASPSRAEGFGLNLLEASQAGVPVITNGWRLPKQLAERNNITTVGWKQVAIDDPQGHYASIRGAVWSEPDMDALVEQLAFARAAR